MKKITKIVIILLLIVAFFNYNLVIAKSNNDKDQLVEAEKEEIETELLKITEEEQEVLERLFSMKQEIDILNRDVEGINVEILNLEKGIEDIKGNIEKELRLKDDYVKTLEEVLVIYERQGVGSFLKIVLNSNNFTDFIKRINTLREFSKRTGELLDDVETAIISLENNRKNLTEKNAELLKRRNLLEQRISEQQKKVDENEEFLKSLQENRGKFEEKLDYIGTIIGDLEKTLKEFTTIFNGYIADGYFPDSLISERLTLSGPTGRINDKELNKFLDAQEEMPKVKLVFLDNEAELVSEKYRLKLKGGFELDGNTKIKFVGVEGSFYGMELKAETIAEILKDELMVFDFENIMEGNTFKAIKLKKGYLDMIMRVKIF